MKFNESILTSKALADKLKDIIIEETTSDDFECRDDITKHELRLSRVVDKDTLTFETQWDYLDELESDTAMPGQAREIREFYYSDGEEDKTYYYPFDEALMVKALDGAASGSLISYLYETWRDDVGDCIVAEKQEDGGWLYHEDWGGVHAKPDDIKRELATSWPTWKKVVLDKQEKERQEKYDKNHKRFVEVFRKETDLLMMEISSKSLREKYDIQVVLTPKQDDNGKFDVVWGDEGEFKQD